MSFDSNGTRKQAQVTILQYRSLSSTDSSAITRVTFAQTDGRTFKYSESETTETVFPGEDWYIIDSGAQNMTSNFFFWYIEGVPPDGTPIQVVSTYHLALVVIYDILAFLGLIFTTVCLAFNFGYRNRK